MNHEAASMAILQAASTRRRSISLLAPALDGGGMTRAYLLARVLQHLRHDVQLIGSLVPGREVYPRPPAGLQVTAVAGTSFPRLARALLARVEGELVYAVKPQPNSFGVALLGRRRSARPVLLDIDDWEAGFFRHREGETRGWARRLTEEPVAACKRAVRAGMVHALQTMVSRADAVTVNNRALQLRYGGVYLPSGKDTELFDPARYDAAQCREQLGLAPYRVLMFPGTSLSHKGLEDVLAAMDLLDWPDLRLVVVGGRKGGEHHLETLMQRWPNRMLRLPRCAYEDMPRMVAAAHAVVVPQRDTPSARAQFPMKLTDAMAMAKPIIATRVGDIPEVLGDAAYLIDASAPGQLARAIESVFDAPAEAAARGAAARGRCIDRYSLEALGRVMAGVLDHLD